MLMSRTLGHHTYIKKESNLMDTFESLNRPIGESEGAFGRINDKKACIV